MQKIRLSHDTAHILSLIDLLIKNVICSENIISSEENISSTKSSILPLLKIREIVLKNFRSQAQALMASLVTSINLVHVLPYYGNTPMQYIGIFTAVKRTIFRLKNCDTFLIFAPRTDCGYLLEPPCIPSLCFIHL